jgi:S1-C subfamily serine protease
VRWREVVLTKNVSWPVAALLILVVILVSAALFHNARLAPPETTEPARPPEPPLEQSEVNAVRRGLKPLGVVAVMTPLQEDRGVGVRVAGIVPGSPAEKAGIQMGDRIDEFNGNQTVHPMALIAALGMLKKGQAAKVVIDRSGKKLTLSVTGVRPIPPEELGNL